MSRDINISNTRWYISIELEKYCRGTGEYIEITPESTDQPETLAAYVYGDGRNSNEGSFDVKAKFMLTHLSTVKTKMINGKFSFNSSNKYEDAKGVSKLALIEVAINFSVFYPNLNLGSEQCWDLRRVTHCELRCKHHALRTAMRTASPHL